MNKKLIFPLFLIITMFAMSILFACGPKKDDEPTDGDDGGSTVPDELEDIEYIDMVSVTGDTFTQRDTDGNSFEHTISNFSIGKYEVTYELWYTVYTWAIGKGYNFANKGIEGHDGTAGSIPTDASKYEPVTRVNWRDAIVWCNAYSELCGLTPVYKSPNGNILKDSRGYLEGEHPFCDKATMDISADGYRLPTEGEWYFAASNRGSTPYNYASGATSDYTNTGACDDVAWYEANSGNSTHAVGNKTANGLGLYDMSGNIDEWCWDWSDDYPSDPQTDYTGPDTYPDPRILRVSLGNNWYFGSEYLQVGYRSESIPYYDNTLIGLRVVRRP